MDSKKGLYRFSDIEKKWQRFWEERRTFAAKDCPAPIEPSITASPEILSDKRLRPDNWCGARPKYYVLDMFPYPSAQGLHVGHPEGYTASDIIARYKRMKGFNVLHPMGWDAFGLPAEQYAVETGTHPAETTQKNIDTMRRQIKSLGFSYDWDREVNTTDPNYYKWTQWIFLKFFNSYFDEKEQKARPIEQLPIPAGLSEQEKQRYIDDHRLAYEAEVPVNWCPALGTVLANEEVVGGVSERGGHPVIRKPMRQWMLRITKYAERLLEDLADVDWPESIKKLQTDWIGKSIGAEVDFKVDGFNETIRIFTTRPDTLFGATYMVLAPEHELVDKVASKEKRADIEKYRQEAARKSDLDRTDLAKGKTGEPTGAFAINPVNNEKIPIWISDYVLISYGTGAIMAVPAHDERDFEFAKKFSLPIRAVVMPSDEWLKEMLITLCEKDTADPAHFVTGIFVSDIDATGPVSTRELPIDDELKDKMHKIVIGYTKSTIPEKIKSLEAADPLLKYVREDYIQNSGDFPEAFIGEGHAVNSGQFNDLPTAEFKEKITQWLAQKGLGKKAVNYKLRDWLFSRQRYWGEPFPILHTEDGRVIGLQEKDLPLKLPQVENYTPSGTGESPLANIEQWVNITSPDGSKAKRETNTMPQWAGSCWYYLRYLDPNNNQRGWDPQKEKYWMPVDLYIGGAEHAVLHLLYSRFWHKFLYDLGLVSTKEPFKKLVNQGMILGEDGQKMSKSRGNVINPDKVVADYGADSMRLYEMFMGPLESIKPWNIQGVEGVHRFLQKVWRTIIDEQTGELAEEIADGQADEATLRLLHQTIKKVGSDIETFGFNTAISTMMIFVNHLIKQPTKPKSVIENFVLILAPFAPHIAEELWEKLGHTDTLAYQPWPQYDKELVKEKEIELAVQVNGKIKGRITISADLPEEDIKSQAIAAVRTALVGKEPRRVIVVKPRIVSIVT